MFEEIFREVAAVTALGIEACVVLIVAFGSAQALVRTVGHVGRGLDEDARRGIWLGFATWILLALEFALAADIIRSAISPTWDEIGKLGAIATIRTLLNYFLAKDIESFAEKRRERAEAEARGQA
ncbi:MAG: DUF1622 domain-containing protein [Sandaracinobacteroides sp.]